MAGREEGQYGARFTDTRGEERRGRSGEEADQGQSKRPHNPNSEVKVEIFICSVLRDKSLVMYSVFESFEDNAARE